jgi:hypothetical protein
MAISFPRTIPDELPIVGLSFFADPMMELTPLRSGRKLSVELGPTLWRGRWRAEGLTRREYGVVAAWYDTLLSSETFLGFDKRREYPIAYSTGWGGLTVGGSPFDGTATLSTVAENSREVDLGDLPAGFELTPGDYLAFDYGADASSRALHRVVAAATASGGGDVTVEVRPPVRTGWQVEEGDGRTVSLYQPAAQMIIVPGSYTEASRLGKFTDVSFEAVQTL